MSDDEFDSDSHVLADDLAAGPDERGEEPDPTVISTTPPLGRQPVGELRPREMGSALVGRQLHHVLLEEFVGGGGMGAVFRGWDTNLHRTVAVKVLATIHGDQAETQRRFETEARSAARLDHPHIAHVYHVGQDQDARFIVFEFIDGTNVRDLVQSGGPLALGEALQYTLQIAGALVHAWQREVVHRDIKPSNILITKEGQAKLVDMGLARFERFDQADDEQTATGVTLGTFDYISPEQARDPRAADTRSDIYSLGCTLFFMLVGRPPFAGGTAVEKILQHQGNRPPDLAQIRRDVPESVVSLVETMLAKRAVDRFQNPAELAATLAAILEQLGMTPPPMTLGRDWPARFQPRWPLVRHAGWLVPVAMLVVGVVALELLLGGESPPEFPPLRHNNLPVPASTEESPGGPPPLLVPAAPAAADDVPAAAAETDLSRGSDEQPDDGRFSPPASPGPEALDVP